MLVKWKSCQTFFAPTFVYCNVSGSFPNNAASILETEKSRTLMTSKLDKKMYWKMPMAATLLCPKVWLFGVDSSAPQLASSSRINTKAHLLGTSVICCPAATLTFIFFLSCDEGLLHWEKPCNTDQMSHFHPKLPGAPKMVRFEWPAKPVIQPWSLACSWIFILNWWYRKKETDVRIKDTGRL